MLVGIVRDSADISIHAPHEGERPPLPADIVFFKDKFQSTLPTRGSDLSMIQTI